MLKYHSYIFSIITQLLNEGLAISVSHPLFDHQSATINPSLSRIFISSLSYYICTFRKVSSDRRMVCLFNRNYSISLWLLCIQLIHESRLERCHFRLCSCLFLYENYKFFVQHKYISFSILWHYLLLLRPNVLRKSITIESTLTNIPNLILHNKHLTKLER